MDPTKTPVQAVEATPAHRALVEEAFVTAAWADFHDEIYAFLVRSIRDPDAAEDLLQDAYLRLMHQVRAGGAPDNTRAWLYRVAANLAASRGRRIAAALRGVLRLGGRPSSTTPQDAPEARALEREARHELGSLLERLSPDARAAILLSSEGFSGTEIAAAIGRSDAATRTLLCRARVRVRRGLEPQEPAP